MKMEEKDKKKNAPMKREEVIFSVNHEGKATPSRADLLKEVASKLKVKDEFLIIDKIFSTSGKSESEITVLVYKKKDDIPKGKLEKMKRRMEKKKKKPEEPKPAEKPAEGEAGEVKEVKEEAKETAREKEKVETEEKPAEEAKPAEEKPAEVKEEEKAGEKKEEKKE